MSKTIEEMTIEELKEHLKKKEEQLEKQKLADALEKIPSPLPNPDFSFVIKLLQKEMQDLVQNPDHYTDDDFQYWVYEKTCEALFGKAYGEFMRKHGP